ncbi:aminoacyl-tRNA hydrolase [Hugenholtzia roseola]|uniref:aminoacyl-tRNA hydrolase n=1 Tax=Hugenholtzia roseola TaxID=1002 RepID=UPI0003F63F82|nr:aminoacyl-tRNA hydrolase [Hugenholtzia roseola]
MDFLIAGLGNIGQKYANTRHNIGFMIADALAKEAKIAFRTKQNADLMFWDYKWNGDMRRIHIIKPTTYMNNSGTPLLHWKKKMQIPTQNILVLADDIALPFGQIRTRTKGSAGGHNGLKSVENSLGTNEYNRMRIGVKGDTMPEKMDSHQTQVDYVLGDFTPQEMEQLPLIIAHAVKACLYFPFLGIEKMMNKYNANVLEVKTPPPPPKTAPQAPPQTSQD